MDNCFLSDKLLGQMDVFQDLVPDRDSDVFVRNQLSQPGCQPTRNWDTGEDFCHVLRALNTPKGEIRSLLPSPYDRHRFDFGGGGWLVTP